MILLEADGLETGADPGAVAKRLRVWAKMVAEGTALQSELQSVNMDDMQPQIETGPAHLRALKASRWSLRTLSAELKKRNIEASHTQLNRIFKGESVPTSEIRRAIREITKIKL